MSRPRAYSLVAAAAALPRLLALLHERGAILSSFTEKSDDFARTFLATGAYGLVPGVPSAYTQPLYGWFLIPIYRLAGRSWPAVGLAQIAVAVGTAWLVYELGRRVVSPRVGLAAALVATLNPYLVWHDVHVNREILDQPLAAGLVLVTLLAAERRSLPLGAAAGALAGLAILGNSRLAALPLVVGIYLAARLGGRRAGALAAGVVVAVSVLVVTPWLVRNRVQVGCFALTTDARALWKANNPRTYDLLASGKWIDDVPRIPHAELNPEEALALYRQQGRIYRPHECAQMRFYRGLVWTFWRRHPGEKAKLAGQAVGMLWDPRPTRTVGRSGAGTRLDTARDWAEPVYVSALYALGAAGLFLVRRQIAVLVVAFLAYGTLAATVFVGATRYRAPWDFLIALLAGAALVRLAAIRAERRALVAE